MTAARNQATATVSGTMRGGVEEKRFYMPGIALFDECPKCQAHTTRDFGDEYLSYPLVGDPFEHTMYCPKCEHEWEVRLILRVSLEVVHDRE